MESASESEKYSGVGLVRLNVTADARREYEV